MSNIIKTTFSDLEIRTLLDTPVEHESKLVEDFMIDQGDGTRACFNWELRDKGYTLVDQNETYSMNDDELLKDAYRQLNLYQSKK